MLKNDRFLHRVSKLFEEGYDTDTNATAIICKPSVLFETKDEALAALKVAALEYVAAEMARLTEWCNEILTPLR